MPAPVLSMPSRRDKSIMTCFTPFLVSSVTEESSWRHSGPMVRRPASERIAVSGLGWLLSTCRLIGDLDQGAPLDAKTLSQRIGNANFRAGDPSEQLNFRPRRYMSQCGTAEL